MKTTVFAMFIDGDTPPNLGFPITWYSDYESATKSNEEFSGYFKPSSSGGKSNVMVLSNGIRLIANPNYIDEETTPDESEFLEEQIVPQIDEVNLSNTNVFANVFVGEPIVNKHGIELIFDDCVYLDVDSTTDGILKLSDSESERIISTKGGTKKVKKEKKDKMEEKKWKFKE